MGVAEGFCGAVHLFTSLLAEPVQPLAAQQFHQHQRLIDEAHAHPLGDVLPEALVGGDPFWRGRAAAAANPAPGVAVPPQFRSSEGPMGKPGQRLDHLRCRGPTGAVLAADRRRWLLESPLYPLEPRGLRGQRRCLTTSSESFNRRVMQIGSAMNTRRH